MIEIFSFPISVSPLDTRMGGITGMASSPSAALSLARGIDLCVDFIQSLIHAAAAAAMPNQNETSFFPRSTLGRGRFRPPIP